MSLLRPDKVYRGYEGWIEEIMLNFILIVGFFILIAFIVSFALSIATVEENPKVIIRIALKNFGLLFLIVLLICIIATIISFYK